MEQLVRVFSNPKYLTALSAQYYATQLIIWNAVNHMSNALFLWSFPASSRKNQPSARLRACKVIYQDLISVIFVQPGTSRRSVKWLTNWLRSGSWKLATCCCNNVYDRSKSSFSFKSRVKSSRLSAAMSFPLKEDCKIY